MPCTQLLTHDRRSPSTVTFVSHRGAYERCHHLHFTTGEPRARSSWFSLPSPRVTLRREAVSCHLLVDLWSKAGDFGLFNILFVGERED